MSPENTEEKQMGPLVLVEKTPLTDKGKFLKREVGHGIIAEDYCAILIQKLTDDEVEVTTARIRGKDFSTLSDLNTQTLKIDTNYNFRGSANHIMFCYSHSSKPASRRVKVRLTFPKIYLLTDEEIEAGVAEPPAKINPNN